MLGDFYWIVVLILIIFAGVGIFAVGTRARADTGGYCEVDTHWWFGWWVRCTGGERCDSGNCTLQWRKKGSDEHWADAGVIPGGSVKWSENMEYRCVCAD